MPIHRPKDVRPSAAGRLALGLFAGLLAFGPPACLRAQDGGGYVPHRVYDVRRHRFTDFEAMAAQVARADAAFFGEQHDDPATHRLERALLEALARRRGKVSVAMEMWERDVQPLLSAYLAGTLSEDSLRAGGRPWPRYATDYRPLVEWARAGRWPVIASNVPRPYAAAVARGGLASLDSLPAGHRAFAAREVVCPGGAYRRRFAEAMAGMSAHGLHGAEGDAAIQRFYLAQCLKDETMAESVAAELERSGPGTLVVHFNGAFHTDFHQGLAAALHRRAPHARIVTITALPVADLDRADPRHDRRRADFLLYTLAPPDTPAKQ
ncbi:MAG: hypothetical protein JWM27_2759 [Gemmatimonadetes bacterium]|nr:hypothetical protein [Gemmatimonadota bacterium]